MCDNDQEISKLGPTFIPSTKKSIITFKDAMNSYK